MLYVTCPFWFLATCLSTIDLVTLYIVLVTLYQSRHPVCRSRHPVCQSRHPVYQSRHPVYRSLHQYIDLVPSRLTFRERYRRLTSLLTLHVSALFITVLVYLATGVCSVLTP